MVLLGQQRRGDEHGGLASVLHRLERGADRDLRLAEPDVADDQPVHRPVRLHVGLHVRDGGELIGRLLVREGLLELALPRCVDGERVAGGVLALLVQHHQLLRDLVDLGPGRRLGAGELGATHLRQAWRVAARVHAHAVDLLRRHVQPVVTAVLQQQVVALDPADRPLHHPGVAGDAVVVVHDVAADLEVVEGSLRGAAPRSRRAVRSPATGEVGLGQHRELHRRQDHPALDRRTGDDHAARARHVDAVVRHRVAHAVVAKQLVDPFRRPGALGGDHDAIAGRTHLVELADELGAVGTGLEPRGRGQGLDARALGRDGHRPHRCVGVGQQPIEVHVELGQVGGVGDTPRGGERAGEVGLLRGDVDGAVAHPARLDQDDLRVVADEVEQHVGAVGEPRQPRLHPVEGLAVGQPRPLLTAPGLRRHQRLGALPDLVGRQQLAAREDLDALEVDRRALVGDRELGEPVDLVAPQVDAHRRVGDRREDVDDRSTHRDLATVLHLVLPPVPAGDEQLDGLVQVEHRARRDHQRLDVLHVRSQALDECPRRRDDHVGGAIGIPKPPHGAHPPPHRLGGRADAARTAASPTPGTGRHDRFPGRCRGRTPDARRRRSSEPPRRGAGGSSAR